MIAKFIMRDENFKCDYCGHAVKQLGYTARNHCPKCLASKHLDNNPGDRLNDCHGKLKAINIEPCKKKEFKIVHQCEKCGMIKRNKIAADDDFNKIINLTSNQSK